MSDDVGRKRLADKCAEEVYLALARLDDGNWEHDADTFLPANVLCDHGGRCKFLDLLSETIEAQLPEGEGE